MSTSASQANAALASAEPKSVRVWDLPLRFFHWLLVLAVVLAFLSSEEDSPLNQWHIVAGWVAGILIAFRIVWGLVGGEHSRFVDFVRPSRIGEHIKSLFGARAEPTVGHNPLGGLSVIILLALTGLTVATGAFGGEPAEDLHKVIAWTLLAFVGIHVAAVLLMSLFQRENLVTAMITGKKALARHDGAIDARRPSAVGVEIAIIVVAATIYGVLQYDPQAFTLRGAEAFQERGGSIGDSSQMNPQREKDD